MEDDVELTVRHARARIDGDTARVEVTTDRGRVTLRMHRLVLGALGGAIARALWPKAGEDVPVFADAEPQDVPIQPGSREPEGEAVSAVHVAELHDVAIQPASQEPDGEAVGAGDGAEPQGFPIQSQEPEGELVGAQADMPHDIPAQHESQEPEVLVAFDALWPEGEEPVAPSAGVELNNIPTQPEAQDREGEGVAAYTDAEPRHVPTQPEAGEPAGEIASLAGAEPPNDTAHAEQPARRKASGPKPRRKWR